MYMKVLWFLLATAQLTHSIMGCDYQLLDLIAKSHTKNIWSSNSDHVTKETIKDDLLFLNDMKKIEVKYTQENKFKELCSEIELKVHNQSFLNFLGNCKLIYDSTSNYAEKYAVHILLERVKEKFSTESAFFERISGFHKNREILKSLNNLTITTFENK